MCPDDILSQISHRSTAGDRLVFVCLYSRFKDLYHVKLRLSGYRSHGLRSCGQVNVSAIVCQAQSGSRQSTHAAAALSF